MNPDVWYINVESKNCFKDFEKTAIEHFKECGACDLRVKKERDGIFPGRNKSVPSNDTDRNAYNMFYVLLELTGDTSQLPRYHLFNRLISKDAGSV